MIKINSIIIIVILLFKTIGYTQNNNIKYKKVKLDLIQGNSVQSIKPSFRNIDILMNLDYNDLKSNMQDYRYELGASDDYNKSYLFTNSRIKNLLSIFWINNGTALLFGFPKDEREALEIFKKELSNAIDNRLVNFENINLGVDKNNNPVEEYWIKTINNYLYIKLYEENGTGYVKIKKYENKENESKTSFINNCPNFLFKAKLVNTIPQYMYLFSEKTYSDETKKIIKLPVNAIVYVLNEFSEKENFYYVCYNGVTGYVSKQLLLKL